MFPGNSRQRKDRVRIAKVKGRNGCRAKDLLGGFHQSGAPFEHGKRPVSQRSRRLQGGRDLGHQVGQVVGGHPKQESDLAGLVGSERLLDRGNCLIPGQLGRISTAARMLEWALEAVRVVQAL